jgi:transcriptional regulator with XRE-family HTH domain
VDLRAIRRTARLTQLEVSRRTGIDRAKLSFAECGYVELSSDEQAAIRKAIAEAADNHAAQVRRALEELEREPGAVNHVGFARHTGASISRWV